MDELLTRHDLERDGVALTAWSGGDGDTIVLLHGYPQTSHMWRHLVPPLLDSHHVVLMDLRMPVMGGLAATKAILSEYPEARIIVLTTFDGDEDIHRALAAGARGYLLKEMLRTEVLRAVRDVLRGRRGIPAPIAARLAEHTPRIELTPRELEVLDLVARGLSNGDIAAKIGRTEGTVKVHLRNILQKLDAHDRTAAVTIALQRGFIHLA